MKKIIVFTLSAMLSGLVFADLKNAVKVFESGKWAVLRDINMMTDQVDCTGVYGTDYSKQLTRNKLFVGIKGGVTSVTMRFDDNGAFPFRLATKIEKDVRSLILEGGEFQSAVATKRLRMQVGTLISGIQDVDINLTGFAEALENINQGCPVPAASPVAAVPLVLPATKDHLVSTCNADLISRMQKAGVTKAQLTQVCGPR